MGDERSLGVIMSNSRERDRELLIPMADSVDDGASASSSPKPAVSTPHHHHSGREVAIYA